MFDKLFLKDGIVSTLLQSIENKESVSVFGTGLGEKIALTLSQNKMIIFVATDASVAREVAEIYKNASLKVDVITSAINYDLNAYTEENLQIFNTLAKFTRGSLDALVITPALLLSRVVNKSYILDNCKIINKENCDFTTFLQLLTTFDYKRVDFVTKSGEYAVRGDIVDVFALAHESPFRLYFDFDQLSEIKEFDNVTMLTTKDVTFFSLTTNSQLEIDNELVKVALQKHKKTKEYFSNFDVEQVEILAKNNYWFVPFSKNCSSNILDLTDDALIVFSDAKKTYFELVENEKITREMFKTKKDAHKFLAAHSECWFTLNEVLNKLNGFAKIAFQLLSNANNLFKPSRVFSFGVLPKLNYSVNLKLLANDVEKNTKYTYIIFVRGNEGAVRVKKSLGNRFVNIAQSMSNVVRGEVNLVLKDFPLSFSFADEKIVAIGVADVLGREEQKSGGVSEIFLPVEGDFVVHARHGVGKCLGVQALTLSGSVKDYVVISYKFDDRLYVPVENLDSLSKYVSTGAAPSLNKIGGVEFARIKKNVKDNLRKMAIDLVRVYAERMQTKGVVYPPDDEMQIAFEKSFSFSETPDQLKAINDIKADMEVGKVMDRLICGDVGFGKTEVALRAAFKTISHGRQVAILCPTTILSEQHFNTAVVRMENFGVKIEVLNRFKTSRETEKILQQLSNGEIDMVVGTHKLLNKNIRYKNLGLLILDEEQKFGVEDKEKLKELRKNINVLTLSATPIPRTLHMSMVGIRDISVIETPPLSRLNVAVQVLEYSDGLVKSAILQELERRGQVLIVYNRVESIYAFSKRITDLLGNSCVVDVAHGQMPQRQLENAIFKLYNRQTDVLIATTLIENGIDLPNANTLIIVDADNLGLSQLYQLKGRVGRSDRQAYAYFTYNTNKLLTENAYKRLQAITEFTALSSGFKIALRDLEIRGAGDVMGKEQHGHLHKVGYAMYVELLQAAINEVSNKVAQVENDEVKITTVFDAFIPKNYIENNERRMQMYQKISKIITDGDLQRVINECEDVYGIVPMEVQNISKIGYIKNLSKKCGVRQLFVHGSSVSLEFTTQENAVFAVRVLGKNENLEVEMNIKTRPQLTISQKIEKQFLLDLTINLLKNLSAAM